MTQPLNPHPRNTSAKINPCPRCQALTITGYSDRVCAWNVRLDPQPVTYAGEIAAHYTQNKHSYTYWRKEITIRDHTHTSQPANNPVLLDHHCHQPIHPDWKDHTTWQKKQQLPDKPAF